MPLSAPEARTRINQQVTVEMQVKAAKNCQRCSLMFLDSEEDHHDAKNFAVAITDTGIGRFREGKIDDPAGHSSRAGRFGLRGKWSSRTVNLRSKWMTLARSKL